LHEGCTTGFYTVKIATLTTEKIAAKNYRDHRWQGLCHASVAAISGQTKTAQLQIFSKEVI
jgi:hypothetical protein